jgi:hypothetical protein
MNYATKGDRPVVPAHASRDNLRKPTFGESTPPLLQMASFDLVRFYLTPVKHLANAWMTIFEVIRDEISQLPALLRWHLLRRSG